MSVVFCKTAFVLTEYVRNSTNNYDPCLYIKAEGFYLLTFSLVLLVKKVVGVFHSPQI